MASSSQFKLQFLVIFWVLFSLPHSSVDGFSKVKGVNLGGWLVVEGWIKPSLFDGIPNGDMLDGTKVQLRSLTLGKYVSAENGGGMNATVDRDIASLWETFRLWRVSDTKFQFRTFGGQFLTLSGAGSSLTATADSASSSETFYIERNDDMVHIKTVGGSYVQANAENQLTADYLGVPGWDANAATFQMSLVENNLHGDYQLANGYGHSKAKEVLTKHWNSFVTADDFTFLSRHGINTVRIPVGWWIAQDPNPPPPFVGGSLAALDKAFTWAQANNIKCIIDLHAAPGSQNGMEHSASKDGSVDWALSPEYVSESLDVIDFLCVRYAKHPALLGFELLNEPSAAAVPSDVLVSYYKRGYDVVRTYSSTAYVIVCQRIGNADPIELYEADIGDHNVVVDLHYYNLFDPYFTSLSAVDNIHFIHSSRQRQLQALNSANGPLTFIGEWVNEWNVTNASQFDYQTFGNAQLEVYDGASFGWSYWTLKNDRMHWDFEWNIKNKYLLLGNSSTKKPNILLLLTLAIAVLLLRCLFT